MKHLFKRLLFLGALALTLAVDIAASGVLIPLYTRQQLRDAGFVRAEIVRLTALKQEIVSRDERLSPVHRSLVLAQLNKIDITLRTLTHIETNGFNPAEVLMFNCPCIAPDTEEYRGLDFVDVRPPAEPEKEVEKVYEITEPGLVPPKPVKTPNFDVTPEIVGAGLSGKMNMAITVGKDGRVADIQVKNELTPALTATVTAQIREKWQFKPATRKGKPVAARMPWTFNFSYTVVQPTPEE